ncbi:hypothetical protein AMAG_13856 [Allomyces macrogynus ATCC 38327]|uniref:Alpha-1,3-mannosyltransferase n=1 Tax=Allomyces macrogynus (strain ATCC 38327) TaxID=578462 RepID=A0A0L0T2W5_ALLM3|nr:hypothetical protein AMAG_13856 [Allomyces macrogynus ATCC 38327]|eukprot:KNE68980.1 hypothetical protein AMAG_13856 [Allomyces macrogynus ATCC 38327]
MLTRQPRRLLWPCVVLVLCVLALYHSTREPAETGPLDPYDHLPTSNARVSTADVLAKGSPASYASVQHGITAAGSDSDPFAATTYDIDENLVALLDAIAADPSTKAPTKPWSDPTAAANVVRSAITATLARHTLAQLQAPPTPIDTMPAFAHYVRLHRDLYRLRANAAERLHLLADIKDAVPLAPIDELLHSLEARLYPWLKTSVRTLHRSFPRASRGLVYTCGRQHAHYAYVSILGLRKVGSTLPVTIMYGGDNDLPPHYRSVLESLLNVKTMDMTAHVNWDVAKPTGWAMKPFALLLAPYEHTILVDSDVYFLQPPEVLFDDPGYEKTGTLFFHDRTLFPDAYAPGLTWLKSFVPNPSERVRASRFWRGVSQHEMESGVVVVNKATTAGTLGMLATCALNAPPLRESIVYRKVHGDKETFWIGFEVAGEQVAFMPGYGGSIGFLSTRESPKTSFWTRRRRRTQGAMVCGGLLHTDRDRRPLWFNGGLEVDKYSQPNRMLVFEHMMMDWDAEGVDWQFGENSPDGFCFNKRGSLPEVLEPKFAKIGTWLANMYARYQNESTWEPFWTGA